MMQLRLLQLALFAHVTSHEHAEWQSTVSHEPPPVHVIAQSPLHLT